MRNTQQWWNLGGVLHRITHHSLNSLHLVCFYYQSITKMPTGRHRDFWSTSKGGPVFSKLFRLDRTDPLSFGPEFSEILVEWIAPTVTSGTAAPSAMSAGIRLAFAREPAPCIFQSSRSSCFHETTYTPPCVLCWDLHELREQLFYPIREFFSASEGSFRFSLRDVNLTLRLLSTITHVMWHDSVFCVCCEF